MIIKYIKFSQSDLMKSQEVFYSDQQQNRLWSYSHPALNYKAFGRQLSCRKHHTIVLLVRFLSQYLAHIRQVLYNWATPLHSGFFFFWFVFLAFVWDRIAPQEPRIIALNSWLFCLCLPRADSTAVHNQTGFIFSFQIKAILIIYAFLSIMVQLGWVNCCIVLEYLLNMYKTLG